MTDFQDSTYGKLTYKRILDRAKQDALDAMPEFPNKGTYEAWEAFQSDVEDIDACEIAHESSDWDWVIYYHRAMELCQAVPSDVLYNAEAEWHDMCMGESLDDSFGLFELAGQLAGHIVVRAIADAVEEVKEELIDLAQTNMDNM